MMTSPKTSALVEMSHSGVTDCPVPLHVTAPHSAEPVFSVHDAGPIAATAKRTVKVAASPAPRLYAAGLVSRNTEDVSVTLPLRVPVPLFVRVNCRSTDEPSGTAPKFRLVELREQRGCTATG